MKKTVFISSTYEDLKEYRKEVWSLLENYDVNVMGMEEFGARSETPLETCLNEVERSDIYVGIIAFKLGSVEPKTGKSYTRIEYEKAVQENKEILIYLINDDAEISVRHIDFGDKHEKLKNFKKLLKEKHTVDFFNNESDLVEKLEKRFKELLTSKEKEEEVEGDPYEVSEKIIEKFILAPRLYNDREVNLEIKFDGSPFAVSKDLCNNFNLSYGRTIGVPIKITKPEKSKGNLKNIIIEEELIEDFFSLELDKNYEITARLVFTTHSVEKERANFFDYTRTCYKKNPNFNPSLPATDDVSSLGFVIGSAWTNPLSTGFDNPRYIETSEYIEGEGKIILILNEIK